MRERRAVGLFCDAEPVDVKPAAVVADPIAGTEESEFGADPVAFAYVERTAEFGELLAVEAVIECGFGLVVGFLYRFLGSDHADLDAEVEFLAFFVLHGGYFCLVGAFVGLDAVGLCQIDTVFAADEREGGVVIAFDDDAGTSAPLV